MRPQSFVQLQTVRKQAALFRQQHLNMINNAKVLITGGTDGIGREAAIQLASRGYSVTISGRNEQKANELIEYCADNLATKLRFIRADLSSLAETKEFAAKVAFEDFNIVILNAGVMNPEQAVTNDGMETTLMINTLAPYIITTEVLKHRNPASPLHFVFVTSILMRAVTSGPVKFFNGKRVESWATAMQPVDKSGLFKYAVSKTAQSLMAVMVNAIGEHGVTATSVHPGCVMTNLLSNLPKRQQFYLKMAKPFITPKQVAGANVVRAALQPLDPYMYYLGAKPAKLPTALNSPKTVAAFCAHFQQYAQLI